MTPSRLCSILFAVVVAVWTPVLAHAQQEPDDPTPVIREVVRAIYAGDAAAYERLALPHPQRARMASGGQKNEAALRDLAADPGSLQIHQQRPHLWQGKEASLTGQRRYPDGTSALYVVAHRGGPMMIRLQRTAEGWRVDLRWWAAAQAQQGAAPDRNTPEFAVRSLLTAMFRLDRGAAARWLVDPRGLELLFVDAPSQREPSGVYEASVGEMPLVTIGVDESYGLPTGSIAAGSTDADRRLLVGWFGPTEIPFLVRRINGQWRVNAEPYFAVLQ